LNRLIRNTLLWWGSDYEDFLTLWKDADPDIPIYRQAKAEYAELRTSRNRAN
jgi:hypothetical protein